MKPSGTLTLRLMAEKKKLPCTRWCRTLTLALIDFIAVLRGVKVTGISPLSLIFFFPNEKDFLRKQNIFSNMINFYNLSKDGLLGCFVPILASSPSFGSFDFNQSQIHINERERISKTLNLKNSNYVRKLSTKMNATSISLRYFWKADYSSQLALKVALH